MHILHSHQIKIKRAIARSKIGAHPQSALDMLAAIPPSTIYSVTATALADLLDSVWDACQQAKDRAARAAVEDGAIWVGGLRHEVSA